MNATAISIQNFENKKAIVLSHNGFYILQIYFSSAFVDIGSDNSQD